MGAKNILCTHYYFYVKKISIFRFFLYKDFLF